MSLMRTWSGRSAVILSAALGLSVLGCAARSQQRDAERWFDEHQPSAASVQDISAVKVVESGIPGSKATVRVELSLKTDDAAEVSTTAREVCRYRPGDGKTQPRYFLSTVSLDEFPLTCADDGAWTAAVAKAADSCPGSRLSTDDKQFEATIRTSRAQSACAVRTVIPAMTRPTTPEKSTGDYALDGSEFVDFTFVKLRVGTKLELGYSNVTSQQDAGTQAWSQAQRVFASRAVAAAPYFVSVSTSTGADSPFKVGVLIKGTSAQAATLSEAITSELGGKLGALVEVKPYPEQ